MVVYIGRNELYRDMDYLYSNTDPSRNPDKYSWSLLADNNDGKKKYSRCWSCDIFAVTQILAWHPSHVPLSRTATGNQECIKYMYHQGEWTGDIKQMSIGDLDYSKQSNDSSRTTTITANHSVYLSRHNHHTLSTKPSHGRVYPITIIDALRRFRNVPRTCDGGESTVRIFLSICIA